jgi:hypothetical protein
VGWRALAIACFIGALLLLLLNPDLIVEDDDDRCVQCGAELTDDDERCHEGVCTTCCEAEHTCD